MSFHFCPYEVTHIPTEMTIREHVQECRNKFFLDMGNKGIPIEYGVCRFSETHKVPKLELEYHELWCPKQPRVDDVINENPDNDQSISDVNPLTIDSNHEVNPFLIQNVLACLYNYSSTQDLFKYRLVGKLIWNELAVDGINQQGSLATRLVKIIDERNMTYHSLESIKKGVGVIVNINELISILNAGRLENSTLNRIYLNSSLRLNLKEFLKLNGTNIRTLHYDGHSLQDLRQILQACAKNLMTLSLWKDSCINGDDNDGLFEIGDDAHSSLEFPRLESLVIASGELNFEMTDIYIGFDELYYCNPSKNFLSQLFQASPRLKFMSARFHNSFILNSGLSFQNLTTLCIKFRVKNSELDALCHVGLRLKNLRLHGLFFVYHVEANYNYKTDPVWIEFRRILLVLITTQATTLESLAVRLFTETSFSVFHVHVHDSPQEHWSSIAGFPRIPNLHTLILYECSAEIPIQDFGYLFPKLRNLEVVKCRLGGQQVAGPPQPNIPEYPLQIPIQPNSTTSVRSIREINPTLEIARIFPAVNEFHIQNETPHELPMFWPKLKHLYYKNSSKHDNLSEVLAYIRQISRFLVGISPEEFENIEEQNFRFSDLTNLELPRSRPSIFDLNELETFDFGFISYEFEKTPNSNGLHAALDILLIVGLLRFTKSDHIKKLDFILEQRAKPKSYFALPLESLDGLANSLGDKENVNISTNCDESGSDPRRPMTKKWELKWNLDHHNSEWKKFDGLFCDDPDICKLH